MSINSCIVSGVITGDVINTPTSNGKPMVRFTLLLDPNPMGQQTESHFNIIMFGLGAQNFNLQTGTRVICSGRISINTYQGTSTPQIICLDVQEYGSPTMSDNGMQATQQIFNDQQPNNLPQQVPQQNLQQAPQQFTQQNQQSNNFTQQNPQQFVQQNPQQSGYNQQPVQSQIDAPFS